MRFRNGREFLTWPTKAVTVFGMSGLGKTWLANELRDHGWFHYSADYRIGTRYMGEHIVDNFKQEAMKVPLLRELLLSDSIYIASNIRFSNLTPLSTYLGKPGNPAKGGIAFTDYCRRQAQHRDAEINAMKDVPKFIARAHDIYGYDHFICDASGSLCEIIDPDDKNDPVLETLSANTLMLYLRGTEDDARMLVNRFADAPKPMYYNPQFLEAKWAEYKALRSTGAGSIDDNDVDPDDFLTWGFEELLRYRLPVYTKIARRHGYTIDAASLASVRSDTDFLELVAAAVERNAD